ncbi:MAG: hypothetical protein K6G03_07560 [Lachnospiraceae bacterium]|nr:hypothetical protein [Lachnospiraceae bacterium]
MDNNKTSKNHKESKETGITPIIPKAKAEVSKLQKLTDEEIIKGFKYLIHKDKIE